MWSIQRTDQLVCLSGDLENALYSTISITLEANRYVKLFSCSSHVSVKNPLCWAFCLPQLPPQTLPWNILGLGTPRLPNLPIFKTVGAPMNWKYDQDPVVKVDRRIRWHHTTTILRLRIGARLTRYRNCKFHNGCPAISRHADGISRYSVPPSAGPLLPLSGPTTEHSVKQLPDIIQTFNLLSKYKYQNLYDLCSLNGLTFFGCNY